jgi:hypothetical protein
VTQMAAKPTKTITTSGDDKDGGKTRTLKCPHNMGGYCHSCGFHLVGPKHNRETCTRKKEGHVATATCTKRGENRCMNWPVVARVKPSQQDHTSYKGKLAPTS